MVRTYVMRNPRGPRGPYKTKAKKSWTPRRKLIFPPPLKSVKLVCCPSEPPPTPSRRRDPIPTQHGRIATAITLAVNKLLLKPKRHTRKVKGRRLNFKVVSYTEIVNYITQHPRACKLPLDFNPKELPSRSTMYRLQEKMQLDRTCRTRSQKCYPRNFKNLE